MWKSTKKELLRKLWHWIKQRFMRWTQPETLSLPVFWSRKIGEWRVESWGAPLNRFKALTHIPCFWFCHLHGIAKSEFLRNIWKLHRYVIFFFWQLYIYCWATTLRTAQTHVAILNTSWWCQFMEGFPVCWCRTEDGSCESSEPHWGALFSVVCLVRRRANGTLEEQFTRLLKGQQHYAIPFCFSGAKGTRMLGCGTHTPQTLAVLPWRLK